MSGERLELRDDGGATISLTGYASVTNTPYDMGSFTETVATGAFKRSLNSPGLDVQLLVNHTGLPLARTTSGTLRLSEDHVGLRVEADLDGEDPDVLALRRKMARGDVSEMSMAFRATDQDWNADFSKRVIKAADLQRGDVSIVSYGASPTTTASMRSRELLGEKAGASNLTLDERRALAKEIGTRVRGGGRIELTGVAARALNNGNPNRSGCGGLGVITERCPECDGSGDSTDAETLSAARYLMPPDRSGQYRLWVADARTRYPRRGA